MTRPLVLAALLAALAPATAPAATVSGKLAGGPGYTILALAPSGQSNAAKVAGNGSFSLPVPGPGATLHLVTPGGGYYGPVVLARRGKRGVVTLSKRAGAIGKVALKAGYATARAPKKAVSGRGVKLVRGAPLGAGTLGYVRTKRTAARMAQNGAPQPGADPDGDAIPSTFDADDNGNGTLDVVDPQTARSAGDGLFSTVSTELAGSLNANAGGIGAAQVDVFVREQTSLNFFMGDAYARGQSVSAVNVDCGALVYCRAGAGTATIDASGNTDPSVTPGGLWTSLDRDGDGFPDLPANSRFGGDAVRSIAVHPNVTTADIAAGDLFQVRFTTPGGSIVVPTALNLLFVSTPAVASVEGTAVTYPAGQDAPGTFSNPIRLTGDQVALRLWRPQRAGIGGETGFVDMGRLHYGIPLVTADGSREIGCGASAYSGLSPTLEPATAAADNIYSGLFPLTDTAADGVADELAMTFDVGGCLRANGVVPAEGRVALPITAVTESRRGGTDRSTQIVYVCLPGCSAAAAGGSSGGSPGGKADLAVESVTASGCTITAELSNRGNVASTATITSFTLGATSQSVDTAAIAPGERRSVQSTLPAPCGGQVTVTADATSIVDEYSEENNMGQAQAG